MNRFYRINMLAFLLFALPAFGQPPGYQTLKQAREQNIRRNKDRLKKEEGELLSKLNQVEQELLDATVEKKEIERLADKLLAKGDPRYQDALKNQWAIEKKYYAAKREVTRLRSSLRLTQHLRTTETGGAINSFVDVGIPDENNPGREHGIKLLGIEYGSGREDLPTLTSWDDSAMSTSQMRSQTRLISRMKTDPDSLRHQKVIRLNQLSAPDWQTCLNTMTKRGFFVQDWRIRVINDSPRYDISMSKDPIPKWEIRTGRNLEMITEIDRDRQSKGYYRHKYQSYQVNGVTLHAAEWRIRPTRN